MADLPRWKPRVHVDDDLRLPSISRARVEAIIWRTVDVNQDSPRTLYQLSQCIRQGMEQLARELGVEVEP